jgi:hypothetical protein
VTSWSGLIKLTSDGTYSIYHTGNSGLPDNTIYSILVSGNNKWLCTQNAGMIKYDNTTWTAYNPTTTAPNTHGVVLGKNVSSWSLGEPSTYGSYYGIFGYVNGIESFVIRNNGTANITGWTFDSSKFYSSTGNNFAGIQKYVSADSDIIFFAGATSNVGAASKYKVTAACDVTISGNMYIGTGLSFDGCGTGVITGGLIRTKSTGKRIELNASNDSITFFDSGIHDFCTLQPSENFGMILTIDSHWYGPSNFRITGTDSPVTYLNFDVINGNLSLTGDYTNPNFSMYYSNTDTQPKTLLSTDGLYFGDGGTSTP